MTAILYVLLPNGRQQFLDANGDPLASGSVGMYVVGTLDDKLTWQDPYGNAENENPVPLDAAGSALIYGVGQYRQIVKDSAGTTVWDALTYGASPSGSSSSSGFGAQEEISSATTMDLGEVLTHNALITGNAPIASLGDSASLDSPIFFVEFDSTAGFVNSAALAVPGGLDFTASPGDAALVEFLGDSNWKVIAIWPKTGSWTGFGPQEILASAATVQLGSAGSHNVKITGTTGITSLGNQGVLNAPIYKVEFADVLTLTDSANLVLFDGEDLTTAAGDCAEFKYQGTNVWKLVSYTRFSGLSPLQASGLLLSTTKILSGTVSYDAPAGATLLDVELIGGGGGGAGSTVTGGGNKNAGSGGGAGAYTRGTVAAAQGIVCAVGAGGAGGIGGADGTDGGDTTFGALAAHGGGGGNQGATSTSGDHVLVAPAGEGGAVSAAGNLISASGAPGAPGFFSGTAFCLGGNGGAGYFGGGGVGGWSVSASAAVDGGVGAAPGAGGGGAAVSSSGSATPANGGAGSDGIIIVRAYS